MEPQIESKKKCPLFTDPQQTDFITQLSVGTPIRYLCQQALVQGDAVIIAKDKSELDPGIYRVRVLDGSGLSGWMLGVHLRPFERGYLTSIIPQIAFRSMIITLLILLIFLGSYRLFVSFGGGTRISNMIFGLTDKKEVTLFLKLRKYILREKGEGVIILKKPIKYIYHPAVDPIELDEGEIIEIKPWKFERLQTRISMQTRNRRLKTDNLLLPSRSLRMKFSLSVSWRVIDLKTYYHRLYVEVEPSKGNRDQLLVAKLEEILADHLHSNLQSEADILIDRIIAQQGNAQQLGKQLERMVKDTVEEGMLKYGIQVEDVMLTNQEYPEDTQKMLDEHHRNMLDLLRQEKQSKILGRENVADIEKIKQLPSQMPLFQLDQLINRLINKPSLTAEEEDRLLELIEEKDRRERIS